MKIPKEFTENLNKWIIKVMTKVLSIEQYEQLLKYVVKNNYNIDATRCIVTDVIVDGTKYSLTLCFNSLKLQVCMCEVFKVKTKLANVKGKKQEVEALDKEEENEELKEKCFDELLKVATQDKTDDPQKWYEFYLKKIEPVIPLCSLNQ